MMGGQTRQVHLPRWRERGSVTLSALSPPPRGSQHPPRNRLPGLLLAPGVWSPPAGPSWRTSSLAAGGSAVLSQLRVCCCLQGSISFGG